VEVGEAVVVACDVVVGAVVGAAVPAPEAQLFAIVLADVPPIINCAQELYPLLQFSVNLAYLPLSTVARLL
jgi:hypothetical protein